MRTSRIAATLAVSAALALAGCSKKSAASGPLLHVPSPAWEEQVVYFVFTDRFNNGDLANDDQKGGEYDPSNYDKYSGGDLQGIIDKLDYIQGLGATAVWITPPVANMWWDPLQGSGGYHGYWARDLKKVDEHLGTLDTYKALSSALHKRGMYLIQDVVPNHMGNFFTYATNCGPSGKASCYDPADVSKGLVRNTAATPASKPTQAPFDQNDPSDPAQRARGIYHWTPPINDYNDQNQAWNYQLSDLDDLNSESPEVRAALRDSYGYWIKEVGVDAFRVDTVKFVPHDFWNDFFWSTDSAAPGIMAVAKATGRDKFHAFGEVLETSAAGDDSADRKLSAYAGTTAKPELPALLAYPLWAEIGRVFSQGRPTADLTFRLQKLIDPALYPHPELTPIFIDNHDQARFLKSGSGEALLQAVTFLFTVPGIPIVYYGTEQGFTETRASMFKGGWKGDVDHFNTNIGMYKIIRQLSDLRRQNKVFTHGTLDVPYDNVAGAGPLVYRRQLGTETALVFMNTSDGNALFSGVDSGLAAGTVLELLHSESLPDKTPPRVGVAGKIDVALPGRAVIVAHATPQIVAPGTPAAAITVANSVDGKTFAQDTTINGTVTPAGTKLQMVIDGALDSAATVTPAADGSWSAKLPISTFSLGAQVHTLAFWAPDAKVSTPRARFTSNVVFSGHVIPVDDPTGDDHGPTGYTYSYPQDSSFSHQQDITHVDFLVGPTTLQIVVKLLNMTNVWSPDLGFDHVVFNNYFSLPGQSGGATVMPFLSASTPPGFTWSYGQFSTGYSADNSMFTASGATATSFGAPATPASISSSAAAKTVTFTYDRHSFGLSSWNGVRVYVTTWDYDGVNKVFRPISQAGGAYTYGNGNPGDPHIMDDVPPVTLSDH